MSEPRLTGEGALAQTYPLTDAEIEELVSQARPCPYAVLERGECEGGDICCVCTSALKTFRQLGPRLFATIHQLRSRRKPPMTRRYTCVDCGKPPDCPMLESAVWLSIAYRRELLCMACAELRLGREIALDDLKDCPANTPIRVFADRATRALRAQLADTNEELADLSIEVGIHSGRLTGDEEE